MGPTTSKTFEARARGLVEGHPTLEAVAEALLAARAELLLRFRELEKRLMAVARADPRARLLTTVPGVGALVALVALVALTFSAAVKGRHVKVRPASLAEEAGALPRLRARRKPLAYGPGADLRQR